MTDFERPPFTEYEELELILLARRMDCLNMIGGIALTANNVNIRINESLLNSPDRFIIHYQANDVIPVEFSKAVLLPPSKDETIRGLARVALCVPSVLVDRSLTSLDVDAAFIGLAREDDPHSSMRYVLTEKEYSPYATADDLEAVQDEIGEVRWHVREVDDASATEIEEMRAELSALTTLTEVLGTYVLRTSSHTDPGSDQQAA